MEARGKQKTKREAAQSFRGLGNLEKHKSNKMTKADVLKRIYFLNILLCTKICIEGNKKIKLYEFCNTGNV